MTAFLNHVLEKFDEWFSCKRGGKPNTRSVWARLHKAATECVAWVNAQRTAARARGNNTGSLLASDSA